MGRFQSEREKSLRAMLKAGNLTPSDTLKATLQLERIEKGLAKKKAAREADKGASSSNAKRGRAPESEWARGVFGDSLSDRTPEEVRDRLLDSAAMCVAVAYMVPSQVEAWDQSTVDHIRAGFEQVNADDLLPFIEPAHDFAFDLFHRDEISAAGSVPGGFATIDRQRTASRAALTDSTVSEIFNSLSRA